jgi:hypothetical protein
MAHAKSAQLWATENRKKLLLSSLVAGIALSLFLVFRKSLPQPKGWFS